MFDKVLFDYGNVMKKLYFEEKSTYNHIRVYTHLGASSVTRVPAGDVSAMRKSPRRAAERDTRACTCSI